MLVPETIWTQAFCDISAFSFLVPLALTILYKRRYVSPSPPAHARARSPRARHGRYDTFRYAFYDIAIGKAFSATLHAVTIMPESRTHLGGGLPGFLCGGATDRLMSNHVYEVGIGLELWERVGWSPLSWHGRIAVLATYSLLLISSRGHYTVDVVLAWWALAAVHRLGRGGYGPELCEEAALTESQRAFQRAKTLAKRAETERRFGGAGGAEQKAL